LQRILDWRSPTSEESVEYARAWLHTGVKAAEPHLQSAFLAVLAWVAEQLLMAVGSLMAALRDWLDEALGSNVWWSFCVGSQLILVGYTLHLVKVGWNRFAWWAPIAWHCFIHAFRCLWSIYSYIAARPRLIEHNGVTGVIPPLRGPGGARPFDNIEVRAMFRALGAHRKPYAFVGVVEFQGARHAVRLLRNTGTTLTFTRHGAYLSFLRDPLVGSQEDTLRPEDTSSPALGLYQFLMAMHEPSIHLCRTLPCTCATPEVLHCSAFATIPQTTAVPLTLLVSPAAWCPMCQGLVNCGF